MREGCARRSGRRLRQCGVCALLLTEPRVQTVKGIKITDGDTKKEALRRLRAEQALSLATKMEL